MNKKVTEKIKSCGGFILKNIVAPVIVAVLISFIQINNLENKIQVQNSFLQNNKTEIQDNKTEIQELKITIIKLGDTIHQQNTLITKIKSDMTNQQNGGEGNIQNNTYNEKK
ncbi:MAG: hypothetical protein LBT48_00205 [Prevotellaceae bacterium]|jgi:hypothetical protein|nr:hypothetical protein [Prevotellaceae bacterium]